MLEEEAWKTKADKAVTATDRLICITQGTRRKIQVFKNFHRLFSRRLCRFRRGGGKASLAPRLVIFTRSQSTRDPVSSHCFSFLFPKRKRALRPLGLDGQSPLGEVSTGHRFPDSVPQNLLGCLHSPRENSLPDRQPVRGEERGTEST